MADYYVSTTGNDSTGDGSSGNPYASPGKAAGQVAAGGDRILIKAGTYSITSATPNVAGGVVSLSTSGNGTSTMVQIIGYQATVGDNGTKPLLQASGISSVTLVSLSGNFQSVENISVDGANLSSITGIALTSSAEQAIRCKAANCTFNGFLCNSGNADFILCESTGSGFEGFGSTSGGRYFGCVSHGNGDTGFVVLDSGVAVDCLSYGNTGSGHGFNFNGRGLFANLTAYGNGGDGFKFTASSHPFVVNGLAVSNGGYGFNASSAAAMPLLLNCATYNNTSGGVNATNVTRTTQGAVTLTGNPFTNAASGDFSLNNTAGAGAACRAAGIPGAFPGGTTTGYLDIGAAQSQASGGGTTVIVIDDD